MVGALAGTVLPRPMRAATPMELDWDDLIPPGVPYGLIVGEGELDEQSDRWLPIFDANSLKLNKKLDGAYVRMPGFITPLEFNKKGVTEFILVPYVGACIHTPPPPPNQLVYVKTEKPWPLDELWDPVWVVGTMQTEFKTTDLARTGYAMNADLMEAYIW